MMSHPEKHCSQRNSPRACRPRLETLEARLPLGDTVVSAVWGASLLGPSLIALEPKTTPQEGSTTETGRREKELATSSRSALGMAETWAADAFFLSPSSRASSDEIPGRAPVETARESASEPFQELPAAFSRDQATIVTLASSSPRLAVPRSGSDGVLEGSVRGFVSAGDDHRNSVPTTPIIFHSQPDAANVSSAFQEEEGAAIRAAETRGDSTDPATPPASPCSVSLTPNKPSPQLVGDRVVWTATATGCGDNLVFQFSIGPSGGLARVARDFGTDNTFSWAPMQESAYDVRVSVKADFGAAEATSATVTDFVNSRVTGADPVITPTANPLVALYSIPPCSGGTVVVNFRPAGDPNAPWKSTDTRVCVPGQSTNFLVAGMLPNTTYEMVNVTNHVTSPTQFFTTGILPAGLTFPQFTVRQAPDSRSDLSQGLIFHMTLGGSSSAVNLLATDLAGRVEWYYDPAASGLDAIFGTSLTRSGTVLLLDAGFGYGEKLREIDLAGNPVRETNINAVGAQLQARGQPTITSFHHDAQRLPNGDTVVIAQTEKPVQIHGSPVTYQGDMIIVLDQNFQVKWTWNAFDFLDVTRDPIGESTDPPVDWLHSNAIAWSPVDGNLVVSMRHQNWVVKIDYRNGAGDGHVVWRLGAGGDFAISSTDPNPWFSHQHDVHYVDGTTLALFDNGNTRCQDGSDCHSRGQVLALNEQTHQATLVLNADLGNFSSALGAAQRLPNGNFVFTSGLVDQGSGAFGQSIEVLPNGTIAYIIEKMGYEYRSFRVGSLYGGESAAVATVTMLTSSANPADPGRPVTFTASVATTGIGSNPSGGTVTFLDGDTPLATVPLGTTGTAGFTTSALTVGRHTLTARYDGSTLGDFTFTSSTSPPLGLVNRTGIFALGGAPGRVQVRRTKDNSLVADFAPYGPSYTGPVSVAVGDVNGDGYPDVVTGTLTGDSDVRVFDGKALITGTFNPNNPSASLLAQWFPYALQFKIGVYVAVGDIHHNGFADVVTGPSAGNPDVRIYSGKDIALGTFHPNGSSLMAEWFAYGLSFNVGAAVAVGDVDGDGFADVVTGATVGNPHVKVYSGKDIAQATPRSNNPRLLAEWFPYNLNFNVGAFVAVGDVMGDGFGDVITGSSLGNPDVRVYSGKDIAQGVFRPGGASLLANFFGYGLGSNTGITVGAADFENNGKFDILMGPTRGTPNFRVVRALSSGVAPPALFEGVVQGVQGGLCVGA